MIKNEQVKKKSKTKENSKKERKKEKPKENKEERNWKKNIKMKAIYGRDISLRARKEGKKKGSKE